jgi:hypothetical protein
MLWRLALIALAGCGRIAFDNASQPSDGSTDGVDALSGHDEDGDGVPDSFDVCPHLAGNQSDTDLDQVGDACDPNPLIAGDQIALFLTMQPGDQPLSINPATQGVFTQGSDGLLVDGDLGGNFFAGLQLPISAGNVRIDMGVDISAVGNATQQHELAVSTTTLVPNYFGEINEDLPLAFSYVEVTYFDGSNFNGADLVPLANGVHTGAVHIQLDEVINTSVTFKAEWPGEPYTAMVSDNLYQSSDLLQININNLQLEIRYVCMITWP